MTGEGDWAGDGLLSLSAASKITGFSLPYLRRMFDDGVLPGTWWQPRSRKERRVLRSFMADLFAEIRFGGAPVDLAAFAAAWKAAQAERRAA